MVGRQCTTRKTPVGANLFPLQLGFYGFIVCLILGSSSLAFQDCNHAFKFEFNCTAYVDVSHVRPTGFLALGDAVSDEFGGGIGKDEGNVGSANVWSDLNVANVRN